MNKPQPAPHGDDPTPASAGVLFARTHDGLLVAKVGDHGFVMTPGANGRYYLASAWRLCAPMAEWTRADFYSHGGELKDEASFRARVHENAEHQRQRAMLGRRGILSHANTPGACPRGRPSIRTASSTFGGGARRFSSRCRAQREGPSCPSRAGRLVRGRLCLGGRRAGLPELFTEYEWRCADRTIPDWYPDAWEAIHGRPLRPGESHKKDRRDSERDHAIRWVVISAIRSDHHPGMTECVDTLGGDRRAAEQRRYLVPSDEYDAGRFGFVINEARHRLYDGPSDFVGWR